MQGPEHRSPFTVAFGALPDASVVRALLVPALMYDVGRAVWWHSQLARGSAPR